MYLRFYQDDLSLINVLKVTAWGPIRLKKSRFRRHNGPGGGIPIRGRFMNKAIKKNQDYQILISRRRCDELEQ